VDEKSSFLVSLDNFREKELINNDKDVEAFSLNRGSPLIPNGYELLDHL